MEKIELQGIEKRKGPSIPLPLYETLSEFIITIIRESPSGEVELRTLLDEADKSLPSIAPGMLAWNVLQVKIDLQERGVLKISHQGVSKQVIRLNPLNRRKNLS